jgi:hypothetical protein
MENGADLQHAARSNADLNCKALVKCAFHDGFPRSIYKRAKRHVMSCLGVRQLDAVIVFGEGVTRSEVEIILSHPITSAAAGPGNLPRGAGVR